MSLRPAPIPSVPEETARIARAAFPKGNLYMTLRDELPTLFTDAVFAALFPERGKPAQAPWRLALATLLQYAEGLSDRRAAEAVRSRIDWKYLLSLELEDPGFDASVLCEFRARLRNHDAERLLLDTLLDCVRERGLLKSNTKQRTDSTHVLAAVRALNRVELVRETMRHVLEVLALAAPDWVHQHASADWADWPDRYVHHFGDDRSEKGDEERKAMALTIGADGFALMDLLFAPEAPAWLRQLPAVEMLRRIWLQNYQRTPEGVLWREADNIPPAALFVNSPFDADAHLARKRTTQWVGYKVHWTETCEEDLPLLITHVETTAGCIADGEVTPKVHHALRKKDLLPRPHIVDTGYLDAALLVSSRRDFGIELLGPTRPDVKWQAHAGQGFAAENFQLDWEKQQATCPAGKTSISWTPAVDRRVNEVIKIKFSTRDCGVCPSQKQCTRSAKRPPRRTVTVRIREQHEALCAARARVQTEDYRRLYARRAGIEGTLSRGVRRCRLRRSRYIGLARVHLGHLLTAVALNFVRVGEWLAGIPRAKTRRSVFWQLMQVAPPPAAGA
jgi:transposase